ncbi:MAG: arsenate reductase ArsC [Candidatus Methanogranum gryphiswaldense]|nr:MAG: arsenate reductase ArsC [Candidatus Methanogranum sp. U3.2.1]
MKIAFICVHNSCRSQIAEAIGNSLSDGSFTCYSAGSEPSECIDPDAVRHLKEIFGIQMTDKQFPKLISDLPPVDVVVTMGCGVTCPYMPCKRRVAWNIPDPKGISDQKYVEVITLIEGKVKELLNSDLKMGV